MERPRVVNAMRAAVTCAAAALTACSILTDFGGLSPSGPAPIDAATLPIDAPSVPPNEAGPTPLEDAGGSFPDAGFDGGSTLPSECFTKPVAVCETFDVDAPGWTAFTDNGASIARADYVGQPVLFAKVPARSSGNPPVAFWQRTFQATVTKLSFDADLIYTARTVAAPEYHILFQVRLQHGASHELIYVTVPSEGNGFAVQQFKPEPGEIDYRVIQIPPGTAHHVHWDLQVGGQTHVAIDKVGVVDIATPPWVVAGTPTLFLGVTYSDVPTTPIDLALDNVVLLGE